MKPYILALSFLVFTACEKSAPLSSWNGRWNGPEGTYLDIAPQGDGVRIAIRNLDGEQVFDGREKGGLILFDRDGKTETITPGNGQDTGRKWLADKKDCLIVQTGEGYCRG